MKVKRLSREIISGILIAVFLFLMFRTLHALAWAQGIGLYYALQRGTEDRGVYDLLVDLCGIFSLLMILAVPFLLLGGRRLSSFFRLMAMYFALVPVVNMASLIHLGEQTGLFRVNFDLESNLNLLSSLQEEVVPLAILLGCLYVRKGLSIKWQHWILLAGAVLCGASMLCLPILAEILMYWMAYLLVLTEFCWLEGLFERAEETYERILLWVLMGVFVGRGCYRMLEILEVYPFQWPF